MGTDTMILFFWMLSFKPTFSLCSFAFIKRFFSSSSLSATRMVSFTYLRLLIFLPAILIPACPSSSPAFGRRKWKPTPIFLPGESHGRRSLVGYSPRGHKESDMTERLHFHFHSAYKLNKQGVDIPWRTPFPIWNQSVVPCPVLTVASWPAYRFLRRQVRWSGIPISWRIFLSCCDPHRQRLWHSQ